MQKSITILGSTGSIGDSTLRVLRSLDNEFRVYGLSCKENISLLRRQIREFKPSVAAVGSSKAVISEEYDELKKEFPGIEFMEGEEGIIELAGRNVDILVSAIIGSAGLRPTIKALDSAKRIALANKESLVMAGKLFMHSAEEKGVEVIPIDSEHSAIFLLLLNLSVSEVERIILTASGGSLRDHPVEDLHSVTSEIALNHPTWKMGRKITIDSATMMNKGLEVIEAHHLFNMDYDSISVIIHPESIVHSMIETVDGSLYAHLSVVDMALLIMNALKYPDKVKNSFGRLRLEDTGTLNFSGYDNSKYPSLELCYNAGRSGGTVPTVLNAANEIGVKAFLEKKILFTDIVKIVEKAINKHHSINDPGLNDIFDADREAREISNRIINGDKI